MAEKQISKKLRIVQRDDGAIFPWSQTLESRGDMRPGWQYIYDDGSEDIAIDKVPMQNVNMTSTPEQIKRLQEENAKLKQQLNGQEDQSQQSVQLAPGEEPIPPAPETAEDLTNAASEEQQIPSQETPVELFGVTKLQQMNKQSLIDHARALDPTVDLDVESNSKAELLQVVTRLQDERKQQ